MLFKDVIGQEEAKQRLIAEVKEGRIPHAQLICGPEGTGKLPLAIAYARYICTFTMSGYSADNCSQCCAAAAADQTAFSGIIHVTTSTEY